jgi:glucose-1-phosphate thymidylyltransferase
MKAIILAGGFATRLWPLTKNRAKPLLILNGKPLLSHIVDKLPKNIEVIVYTNKKFKKDFDDWKEHWDHYNRTTIGCENSRSEKEKLGAIGAVAECIKKYDIEDDVIVIGGDNFFGFSFDKFIKRFNGQPLIAAYDIGSLDKAKKYGVLKVKGNRVIEFHEKPEKPNSTLVLMLCTIIPSESFHHLKKYVKEYTDNYGRFIEYLLKKTEVCAHITSKDWFDIGSFDGYIEAHKNAEKEKEHRSFYLGADFWGKNALSGKVFIDKGTVVKDSKITDCIILSNCEIENSTLKNCIIDEGSKITGCNLEYEMIERNSRLNCKSGQCKITRKK